MMIYIWSISVGVYIDKIPPIRCLKELLWLSCAPSWFHQRFLQTACLAIMLLMKVNAKNAHSHALLAAQSTLVILHMVSYKITQKMDKGIARSISFNRKPTEIATHAGRFTATNAPSMECATSACLGISSKDKTQ